MRTFVVALLVVGCLMLLVYGTARVVCHVGFSQDIGGHMGNAAYAAGIATERKRAVEYARTKGRAMVKSSSNTPAENALVRIAGAALVALADELESAHAK